MSASRARPFSTQDADHQSLVHAYDQLRVRSSHCLCYSGKNVKAHQFVSNLLVLALPADRGVLSLDGYRLPMPLAWLVIKKKDSF